MDMFSIFLIIILTSFLFLMLVFLILVVRIGSAQTELRGLSERVSKIEDEQNGLSQKIETVSNKVIEIGTLTQGLADNASAIRSALTSAQESLVDIRSYTTARQQQEQQIAESIKRLEAVIAGTKTKGTAGENIIDSVFAQLPPEWQVRNFRIGNKTVEFGLRLPNNLVLPIDSKWVATNLVEQFLACDDEKKRQKLKQQIEEAVLNRVKEIQKYIHPTVTVNFGIVVIPDAVFELCSGVRVEALRLNVVLVSYSMFVPYLLLVFQTILKTSRDIDLEKLNSFLETAQKAIESIQKEIEGRFSDAIVMLNNSRDEMRAQVSTINTALTAVQPRTGATQAAELSAPATEVRT